MWEVVRGRRAGEASKTEERGKDGGNKGRKSEREDSVTHSSPNARRQSIPASFLQVGSTSKSPETAGIGGQGGGGAGLPTPECT